MGRQLVRTFIVAVLAIPVLLLSLPAFAQYPPPDGGGTTPESSFGCDGVTPGGTATCSVGGWQPGSDVSVEVTADDTVVFSDSITADGNGFISYSFEVPEGADQVGVLHAGVLADGTPGTFSTTVTATAPAAEEPAAGGLPSTGEMVSVLLVAAVLALGLGTLAVRRGRSRVDVDH